MYIEKHGIMTNKDGKVNQEGYVREMRQGVLRQHSMSDEELKTLFGNIRLNTGFSLPDQLIQDFVNDGSIIPTFKKCMQFNKTDFKNMVEPIKAKKNIRKKLPKKGTQQRKNKKAVNKTRGKHKS